MDIGDICVLKWYKRETAVIQDFSSFLYICYRSAQIVIIFNNVYKKIDVLQNIPKVHCESVKSLNLFIND